MCTKLPDLTEEIFPLQLMSNKFIMLTIQLIKLLVILIHVSFSCSSRYLYWNHNQVTRAPTLTAVDV